MGSIPNSRSPIDTKGWNVSTGRIQRGRFLGIQILSIIVLPVAAYFGLQDQAPMGRAQGPPLQRLAGAVCLFRLRRRAQGFLDRICGVENCVLLRRRHACFGLTIVQMHSPPPPGWAGCLDDLILDTLVLHAGNNGPREQRFLSGFGLTIQNRPLRKSIRPPAPLTACLLRVMPD